MLKGKTGIIRDDKGKMIMHINDSYSNNGKVFVVGKRVRWVRMSLSRAKKQNRTIITCCQCDKPAIHLDHSWPYMQGMTLCNEHKYDPNIVE